MTNTPRPLKGVMFGITHEKEEDGTARSIIREPRLVKVGIGFPKGPAISVWMSQEREWMIRVGYKKDETTTYKVAKRSDAEAGYKKYLKGAPICPYPRKIPFFTFSRPVVQDDGEVLFEPEFDAIEAYGPTPNAIGILFLDNEPFDAAYQMWTSSELKCKGDGVTAMRVVSMGKASSIPEHQKAAAAAEAAGEKYFPLENQCWIDGCPYSKSSIGQNGKETPSPCKPGADLRIQLEKSIRVGGTAYFHTSGIRSAQQIHSALERIKQITQGRLRGIPLTMRTTPYKTKHNGQTATQHGISLEFRAEDFEFLKKHLIAAAYDFAGERKAPLLIESADDADVVDLDDEAPTAQMAQAMAGEFYPEETSESEPATTAATGAESVANATQVKTDSLADRLAAKAAAKSAPAKNALAVKEAEPDPPKQSGPIAVEDRRSKLAESEPGDPF